MEYAIVDIETTGSYAGANSITEIAIIIHNGLDILEKYQTLVNPKTNIPFHIQTLTGISNEMVENAPTFDLIADKVFNLLQNRIFVAHNVNFDYSFLAKELKSEGYDLRSPKLCTVRLARKIIPNLASYSLGKLCQNLNIANNARHRAMGDADATTILFQILLERDQDRIILNSISKKKEQKLPTHVDEDNFFSLPETSGIYFFKNKSENIIYVGKAINIKKRVLSHFTGNNSSQKRQSFINEIHNIDYLESGTELMALLMECKAIQEYWPKHNSALKKFEPKFGLICYEDQKGYMRLLISPFNKNANIIQYFERANDGNSLLLELIKEFELDSRLCSFYTVQEDFKVKTSFDNQVTSTIYNFRVNKALDYIKSKRNSFVIIDQGRTIDEKSYILYKEDQLHAFGFISAYNQFNTIEDLIQENDKCKSNYYMTSLVLQYTERFPSKVIKL